MAKFHCEVTFDLETTIEADGISFNADYASVEDFSDNSYFGSSDDITVSGGELRFTVEADDEEEAEEKALEVVNDGNEVTDYNSLTWLVANVSVSVEQVEEPMTLERAIATVEAVIDRLGNGELINDEEREAFRFLLRHIAGQAL